MTPVLTADQVRAVEAVLMAGRPQGELMGRAARALADACVRALGGAYGRQVVVLAGAGNNGADALFAGALLARRGALVTAVCVGEPLPAALAALLRAGGRRSATFPRGAPDLTLDGLVGIGGRGGLRAEAAALLAKAEGTVVAVDLPSGVDADTGAGTRHGDADLTVTFGALKAGLLLGVGRRRAGRVELVDLGFDRVLDAVPDAAPDATPDAPLDAVVRPRAWTLHPHDVDTGVPAPPRHGDLHKYTRGVLGVAAGSRRYTGAAVLAVGGALQAGAGMVRFAGTPHAADAVRRAWPEAVVDEAEGAGVVGVGRVQAWLVGPGLGTDDAAAQTVRAVLAQDVPVVVDADALTVCARHPQWLRARTAPTVLTPHDGEFARFGSEVGDDRLAAARGLARDLGCIVLLKGVATVVAAPDGDALINTTGVPALATAGSGDVLAGGLGALLALAHGADDVHRRAWLAAGSAAHLHGVAGRLAADGAATTAGGVLRHWAAAVRETTASVRETGTREV